jgi:energy-coupling factor transporter ATP-binding protein EcfA2
MPPKDFRELVGTELLRAAQYAEAQVPTPAQPGNSIMGSMGRSQVGLATQAMNEIGMSRWTSRGDNFYGVADTLPQLAPGCYRANANEMIGPILSKMKVETDSLLELPDAAGASIIAQFQQFWTLAEQFKSRGFLHKRGFLLWGPPGSGKTSQVQIMIKRLVEQMEGIVVVIDHPATAAACLQMLRKIEPSRPVIVIMEDIDALVHKFGEAEYLALLDGEAQVDNCVFLATTNYPERLDPRFVDRPSRFDVIKMIGMPGADARRLYLTTKEPSLAGEELERWVKASEGFSVAHLKEMIVAVKCFEQSLEEVVERLAEMHDRKATSEEATEKSIQGFLGRGKPRRLDNGHARH